jgi:drug/metabolite transporter (DMT)-like permease
VNNHLLALLLIMVAALWGWTFVVVKDAIVVYGVVGFLAIRFTIGALVLGAASARRINAGTLKIGLAIGVVLTGAYYLQTMGLKYTTSTKCGLITGLFVVFAPLAARLLFGVKTSWLFWFAIAMSLTGLGLLTGTGPEPLALGDLLTLGCAVLFGLHIALLARYAREHDAVVLTFAQLSAAALMFIVLWPATEVIAWPSRGVWFALVITGVFASAVAFLVQTFVQQRLPAARTAVILSTEPVFAAIFGYLLHKDRLDSLQIIGAATMVAAILLAEFSSNGRGKKEQGGQARLLASGGDFDGL